MSQTVYRSTRLFCAALISGAIATAALAGEADVVAVKVTKSAGGVYRFDVTVAHADSGWEHFADKWQVLDLDGNLLGERVLAHPHVREQPFTRSSTVKVAPGVRRVRVRAHDKVHEFGGKGVVVDLVR